MTPSILTDIFEGVKENPVPEITISCPVKAPSAGVIEEIAGRTVCW